MSELLEGPVGEQVVLVDMDGVLADFEAPNDAIVRAQGITPVSERSDFYYADTYRDNPALCNAIYRENRQPGFFRDFPLVDGALDGWQRILEAGFMPRVCSSPIEDHPTIVAEKQAWLEQHFAPRFGSWVVNTAIFNRDKSGYDASAIIDDRPTLRNIEAAQWQHILFTCSYNTAETTNFRLQGWRDPALEHLLNDCRARYNQSG